VNLPFTIAKRYFFSRKRGGGFSLISVISGISLLGYVVGAAALVIVLSVFNGFEQLFSSLYTNFDSDLRVTSTAGKIIDPKQINWAKFEKTEGIETYSKVVEENVLLRYNNQQSIATLKGVDRKYVDVTHFDSMLVGGYVDVRLDSIYAIAGQGIAYRLSIDPNDLFKALAIYVPKRDVQTIINPDDAFNKALVVPSGVFAVQEEVDNKYVICPLGFAQGLLGRDDAFTAIEIKLTPNQNSNKVKAQLQEVLGNNFTIKNRFEQHDAFFKVMRSEKAISYIILLFILLIAASNTISSLYILVMEKKRDLLIMRSMGLTENQAANIFRMEGLIIAFVGGTAGIILGLILCYLQEQYGFVALQASSDALFSSYPVRVIWSDVLLVFGTVLVLGYITTIYPAKRAKQGVLN
jgi:lipoprotein-releasing system permease protein